MTRKDYILIAGVLSKRYNDAASKNTPEGETARSTVYTVAVELGYALKRDNPQFDPIRFIDAVKKYNREE